jgi:hypothetical protein
MLSFDFVSVTYRTSLNSLCNLSFIIYAFLYICVLIVRLVFRIALCAALLFGGWFMTLCSAAAVVY